MLFSQMYKALNRFNKLKYEIEFYPIGYMSIPMLIMISARKRSIPSTCSCGRPPIVTDWACGSQRAGAIIGVL